MLMPRAPEPAPEPVVPLFVYADPRDLDIRDPQVFAAMVAACRREARVREWPMVASLLAARWRFELPGGPDADPEPMSWYWRRPPRRRGSQGQLYRSTGQAYGALMRQTPRG
jgi:hypothetical protein